MVLLTFPKQIGEREKNEGEIVSTVPLFETPVPIEPR